MYAFKFTYVNNSYQEFEHIVKVEYYDVMGEVTISDDEIALHKFPIGTDMFLFSDKTNYSVSGANVKFISVTKES